MLCCHEKSDALSYEARKGEESNMSWVLEGSGHEQATSEEGMMLGRVAYCCRLCHLSKAHERLCGCPGSVLWGGAVAMMMQLTSDGVLLRSERC